MNHKKTNAAAVIFCKRFGPPSSPPTVLRRKFKIAKQQHAHVQNTPTLKPNAPAGTANPPACNASSDIIPLYLAFHSSVGPPLAPLIPAQYKVAMTHGKPKPRNTLTDLPF
jgi:hypothetical protein